MRIRDTVGKILREEQAGFRPKRDTSEQVLALTSYIEAAYERKQKAGAIFIDLSAAYDTVWRDGLMLKLARTLKCKKTLKLLGLMTGTRYFHVCLGGDTSKTRKLKNGVPQGSVLAPTLFNLYISDIPATTSLKFGYAGDLSIAHHSERVDWHVRRSSSCSTTFLISSSHSGLLEMCFTGLM